MNTFCWISNFSSLLISNKEGLRIITLNNNILDETILDVIESNEFSNSNFLKSFPCPDGKSSYLISISNDNETIGVWKIFKNDENIFQIILIFKNEIDMNISFNCVDCSLNFPLINRNNIGTFKNKKKLKVKKKLKIKKN
jgi:hypothetical protein